MTALGAAGLLKFADLTEFTRSLRTWQFIPEIAIPIAAFAIPTAEFALATCWWLGIGAKKARYAATGLLVCFTIAFIVHWWFLTPPTCGCLGLLSQYLAELESENWILARNTCMIAAMAIAIDPAPAQVRERPALTVQTASHRGFTMIEVILVVATIGMLVAISLPAFGRVRENARSVSSSANLKSHIAVTSIYSSDFQDQMPYATSPISPVSVIRCPSMNVAIAARYFEMAKFWNVALADGYYNGSLSAKLFASRLNQAAANFSGPVFGSDYWYACSFLASPEFYEESSRRVLPSQLRSVRVSEILFADRKSVFVDAASGESRVRPAEGQWLGGYADGHADWASSLSDLAYPTGDGADSQRQYGGHFPGDGAPFMHTRLGVRGRDIP